MPAFSYTAKRSDGETIIGSLDAASEKIVLESLHRQGLVILKIREAKPYTGRRGGVRMDDLAIFARQMATLVDAGIPLVSGLEAVSEQIENRALRETVVKVRTSVEGGTNFTAALAKNSKVFSPLFVNMVKAGEASGHLAEVMARLATYLEKSAALQRKIRSAMIYPAIVILMAVTITSLLVLKVIPAFETIFSSFGAALPLPTRILMAVSRFAQAWFLPLLALQVGEVFLFKWALGRPRFRRVFDRWMLKLIIVGPLVRKVAIAKFARTLSTLVRSGVQILGALEIVSETAGNRVIAEAILQVRTSVREGENISGPLAASGVFPPMVVRMIAVGEQTGRLDEMLTKVAEFYEDQVDTAVAGLTSAIEPLIIAVMGVVIGSIVLAIFLPIFKMSQLVSH
ncbi:MAG: type II secretion system F family protein [Candidatus Omnitrophica bacterium]|nr:type II secretion system F family protein [Candidatus Omnitrophota bacterium]